MGTHETLTELLLARSKDSTAELAFLDANGSITKTLSYSDLLESARTLSQHLLSKGLKPGGESIVLASFPDHESHIRLFWACCLTGIPICPLPVLHSDPSRRKLLFEHLKLLFHDPTLVTTEDTLEDVRHLVPDLKAVTLSTLECIPITEDFDASIFPARRPSEEDTVCLMLTSGSTGNSKAVRLRHSNLLSSVRGKIKHHGNNSTSRFLNWIAFDHVACVSEVHIQALELNASQYHVSPSAVIHNPRNLLTWCSQLRITFSFSPNFLLAQICRDVSAVPFRDDEAIDLSSMRVFISGGEAVPTANAVAFADLIEQYGAPRDALRAGFGMSETCAGCIYDTRPIPRVIEPSTPKHLSLGKTCTGISMRVVNSDTGSLCSALEAGQFQISGPTVFTEYYNNKHATSEAFTEDGWFVTGDLAQIDEEDNLFLVGRDKDCININGVKIPTQDVEIYVEDADIEGVMHSYVFVCPMRLTDAADTETYGVFYQHHIPVENTLDLAKKADIQRANQAIKNTCAAFCSQAPHVVLPLPRNMFEKTALGKVSRSKLSKAYLQGEFRDLEDAFCGIHLDAGESDQLCTPTEKQVGQAITTVFDLGQIPPTRSQNLFDLGASSMHLMRLKQLLQDYFSIPDIPTIEILKRPDVGPLCDYIQSLISCTSQPPVEYHPLVCFSSSGPKPPLFLVHPGVGEVLVFINLARVLKDDRPVYALRARGFDHDDPTFESMEDMEDCYTNAILNAYPSGPYFLAGYSFGGAVAFKIAKKLEGMGKTVAWLGILNLPPHIQFRMSELVWSEVLINIVMFLSLIPSSALLSLRDEFNMVFPEIAALDQAPHDPVVPIQWVFSKCDQKRLGELNLDIGAFIRWVNVAYEINRTGRSYESSGRVRNALTTIFCAIPLPSMGTQEEFKTKRLAEWKDFSGEKFEMVDVDGEHYTMLSEEHVVSFADKLRGALQRAEESLTLPSPTISGKLDFHQVPIIDLSLATSDPAAYFKQLSVALEDVGFGIFINVPGFDHQFQTKLFDLAEQLFSKPQGWKDSLGTAKSYSLRGYFRADNIDGPHKAFAEAYRFGAEMPAPGSLDDPTVPFWLRLHEGPNQWPEADQVPRFREMMEELFHRYHDLNLLLNKHICRLLDIPGSTLNDYFPTKVEFNSAIWHYFPVTPEILEQAKDGFVQGMHEHRDPSTFLTCLIQSRAGLQVQNHQGKWIDIPMVEGGVVCNIGMQLMRLTGGKLVATTHRVNTLKIDQDRYTIPYVLSTRLEKSIAPLPQFASANSAKLHVAPNPKIAKLMAIDDPLIRSGFARLSLFPAATQKLYPNEFEQARQLGIV